MNLEIFKLVRSSYLPNGAVILPDGNIRLCEGRVSGKNDPYYIGVKYGPEYQENRPHVQCEYDGEQCNISIDGKIEYLGKNPKKYANFFIKLLIKDQQLLNDCRVEWNKAPYLYKFVSNNGKLEPR